MEPGKLEAKAIIPPPFSAVYRFWNIPSPENILPITLEMPPLETVSILMLGDIQLMEPRSVIMLSPFSRVQITTGRVPPSILYCILLPPETILIIRE